MGGVQWHNDAMSSEWKEGWAVRTDVGTHPQGSQWTMTGLGPEQTKKSATRDLVQVPDLDPGDYVLSFRLVVKLNLLVLS